MAMILSLPSVARVGVGRAAPHFARASARAPRARPVSLTVSELVSSLAGLRALSTFGGSAPAAGAGMTASAPARVPHPPLILPDGGARLQLTARERELFAFLREVAAESGVAGTTMRVAGGWVRDKLLGRETDDIDLALDNMTGLSFANAIRAALESRGHPLHIGVILANPEQSKHLETVAVNLHGFSIDLVNLRSEEYSSTSRIPSDVHFGSPLSDAARRDLTINSLFFNLKTDCLEDMTGRGLADLQAGRIDTPLEPLETLLDDPLRVLRAIRFGARFGYEIAPRLRLAMADGNVQAQLSRKISRERVLREVASMIGAKGAAPVRAFRLIHSLRLQEAIFLSADAGPLGARAGGGGGAERAARTHEAVRALRSTTGRIEALHALLCESRGPCADDLCAATLDSAEQLAHDSPGCAAQCDDEAAAAEQPIDGGLVVSYAHAPAADADAPAAAAAPAPPPGLDALLASIGAVHADKSERFRVWVSTVLLPLRGVPLDPRGAAPAGAGARAGAGPGPAPAAKPLPDLAESVMRFGLRGMTSADITAVQKMHAHADAFARAAEGAETRGRKELGLLVRAAGPQWRSSLQLALVGALPPLEPEPSAEAVAQWRGSAEVLRTMAAFSQLAEALRAHALEDAWALSPLLDGNELMGRGVPKGREVGLCLSDLIEWQLQHPECARDDALRWLEERMRTQQAA